MVDDVKKFILQKLYDINLWENLIKKLIPGIEILLSMNTRFAKEFMDINFFSTLLLSVS